MHAIIVDYTHVHYKISELTISCRYCWLRPYKVSYSFLLGNIAQNTTTDILIADQLQPPLDMETVDLEWELHKPNCWIKLESFVVVRIVNTSCLDDTYHFCCNLGGRGGASLDQETVVVDV